MTGDTIEEEIPRIPSDSRAWKQPFYLCLISNIPIPMAVESSLPEPPARYYLERK